MDFNVDSYVSETASDRENLIAHCAYGRTASVLNVQDIVTQSERNQ